MTLADYIREMGVSNFAKKYGVTIRATESYLRGARRPRPKLAEEIVRTSPVTWPGIYASASTVDYEDVEVASIGNGVRAIGRRKSN